MPARPEGVYADSKGGWYFKATLGRDPLTGHRVQLTRRGYRTAAEEGEPGEKCLAVLTPGRCAPGRSSSRLTP
jgi:hypothetical protein